MEVKKTAGEAKMPDKRKTEVRGIVFGDGIPKICVPLTARNMEELGQQAEAVLQCPCDMVEWRADFFEETKQNGWLEQALAFLRRTLGERPLLFTFRTGEEGGERTIPLEEYDALNERAAASGLADLVDLELNRGEERLRRMAERVHALGCGVIGSYHDFHGTPGAEAIVEILCRMQSLGADITKAAVMPQTEEDVTALLAASVQMKRQYADRPYITMSMGRLGMVSRLAGALTGSAVTFATAGRASAPGQMDAGLVAQILPLLQG